MADRGIPFSAPMVRALLAGTKTQTRRALNPQPETGARFAGIERDGQWLFTKGCVYGKMAPTCKVGDRLYVRETYYQRGHWEPVEAQRTKAGRQKWAFVPADDVIDFAAPGYFRKGRHHKDPATIAWHKRLGRFMPRRYSRTTLTVTDVRVEMLKDISEADAIAEGLKWVAPGKWAVDRTLPIIGDDPRRVYGELWERINGPGSWEANPWIVAISFDVRKGNIDREAMS